MITITGIKKAVDQRIIHLKVAHNSNHGKSGEISESTKLKIKEYLQELKTASEGNAEIDNDFEFKKQIPELIQDVEDFFTAGVQFGLFTEDIIEKRILPSFEKNFKTIAPLPLGSGLYGDSKGNTIQIMRTPHSAKNLTPKETRKLYMFHEMGHKILNVGIHQRNVQDLKFSTDYYKTIEKIIKFKERRYKWARYKSSYNRLWLGFLRRGPYPRNGRTFNI